MAKGPKGLGGNVAMGLVWIWYGLFNALDVRAYNRLEGQASLVHGVTQLADRNSIITYVKEISSLERHIAKQMRERITRLT